MNKKRSKKLIKRVEKIFFLFGYGYVAVLVLCMLPDIFGFHKYIVSSGSMEPALPIGSCVLIQKEEERAIKEGDVITFRLPDSDVIVTHRVTAYDQETGRFQTKGDANKCEDAGTVAYSQILGVVRVCIPLLGYFLAQQNLPVKKFFAVVILLMMICLKQYHERKVSKNAETIRGKE